MRARRLAAIAEQGDGVTGPDGLAVVDQDLLHVAVHGDITVVVEDVDREPETLGRPRAQDDAIRRGVLRGHHGRRDVQSVVHRAPSASVGAGQASLHGHDSLGSRCFLPRSTGGGQFLAAGSHLGFSDLRPSGFVGQDVERSFCEHHRPGRTLVGVRDRSVQPPAAFPEACCYSADDDRAEEESRPLTQAGGGPGVPGCRNRRPAQSPDHRSPSRCSRR